MPSSSRSQEKIRALEIQIQEYENEISRYKNHCQELEDIINEYKGKVSTVKVDLCKQIKKIITDANNQFSDESCFKSIFHELIVKLVDITCNELSENEVKLLGEVKESLKEKIDKIDEKLVLEPSKTHECKFEAISNELTTQVDIKEFNKLKNEVNRLNDVVIKHSELIKKYLDMSESIGDDDETLDVDYKNTETQESVNEILNEVNCDFEPEVINQNSFVHTSNVNLSYKDESSESISIINESQISGFQSIHLISSKIEQTEASFEMAETNKTVLSIDSNLDKNQSSDKISLIDAVSLNKSNSIVQIEDDSLNSFDSTSTNSIQTFSCPTCDLKILKVTDQKMIENHLENCNKTTLTCALCLKTFNKCDQDRFSKHVHKHINLTLKNFLKMTFL